MEHDAFSTGFNVVQEQPTAVLHILGNFDETTLDVSTASALGFEAWVLESLKRQRQLHQRCISLEHELEIIKGQVSLESSGDSGTSRTDILRDRLQGTTFVK